MGEIEQNAASDAVAAEQVACGPRGVLIAANPYSGHGPTRKRVYQLSAALDGHGLEPRVIWDRGERAEVLGRPDLATTCRCVVVAGGDGTVADVINEMAAAVPLATLPSGNENLFAREFGFTRDAKQLAAVIAAGRMRRIDLARAHTPQMDSARTDLTRAGGRLFSLMLSVGFDAAVVHRVVEWRTNGDAMRRVRRLSYAKPILNVLRSYGYGRVELEADGVQVSGTHAFVFNLPQYGFRLPFAPDARGDDGLVDWLVFERPGFVPMLSYFLSLVRTKHLARPDVHHGRARRVRITAPEPMPVQMDGEAAGMTPVEVEIDARELHVIVQ